MSGPIRTHGIHQDPLIPPVNPVHFSVFDQIESGHALQINESITSSNGKYKLLMQSDRNLVLYRQSDSFALWSTGTNGTNAGKAVMGADGNFFLSILAIVRGGQGVAWQSKTTGHPGAFLKLQNDGNLVILYNGIAIWDIAAHQRAIAAEKINEFHRRTGRNFGPLGFPIGDIVRLPDGRYEQNYQLGVTRINNTSFLPESFTKYEAEVTLSAVKCFGTDDPSGTDETFVIISLISMNPNFDGTDKLVQTMRTEIKNDVNEGAVIFTNQTIGNVSGFPGSGIKIHVAIFDHESGDADQLKNKINEILEDAARKGASALAGAAAADDPKLAGPIGDVVDFEIAGVKPFKILTLGIADLITDILSDDLIDEHDFYIPAETIVDFADDSTKFNASLRISPDVQADIKLNWPQKPEDEYLFSNGDGSYKIYFKITGFEIVRPLERP